MVICSKNVTDVYLNSECGGIMEDQAEVQISLTGSMLQHGGLAELVIHLLAVLYAPCTRLCS